MSIGFSFIGSLLFECPECKRRAIISYPSLSIDGNIFIQTKDDKSLYEKIENEDIEKSNDIQFDPDGYNYIRLQCKHHIRPIDMVHISKEENK